MIVFPLTIGVLKTLACVLVLILFFRQRNGVPVYCFGFCRQTISATPLMKLM